MGGQFVDVFARVLTIPIILLTARSDEDDTLLGFELGRDDYANETI